MRNARPSLMNSSRSFQDIYQQIAEGRGGVGGVCVALPARPAARRHSARPVERPRRGLLAAWCSPRRPGFAAWRLPHEARGQSGTEQVVCPCAEAGSVRFPEAYGQCTTTPLLLLDDIFDKLDARRVEQIVHLVSGDSFGQIFITDTNRDHLDQILLNSNLDYKIFHVEQGEIIPK